MVTIVSRSAWGAQFTIPSGRHVAPGSRRWFVVHWPGGPVGSDPAQWMRNVENHHRRVQGWQAAPGYNFCVSRDGRIWEGCGRDVRGIHSPPRNTDGWGVCCMISIGETPPQAMLNATRALYEWLCGVAGLRLGMSWHGQHHPTACAGPDLNNWVQRGMPAGAAPAPPPPPNPGPAGSPPWPGRILRQPPMMRGDDVRTWQARVRQRGWNNVAVDGVYGPISEGACRQVQSIARLSVDGRVGPNTWPATWASNQGPPSGPAPTPPPPPAWPPPWPGRLLRQPPMMRGEDVRQWQARMRQRGWNITVDGIYGPQSQATCREFQRRFNLQVDGIVGPITWARAFGP